MKECSEVINLFIRIIEYKKRSVIINYIKQIKLYLEFHDSVLLRSMLIYICLLSGVIRYPFLDFAFISPTNSPFADF